MSTPSIPAPSEARRCAQITARGRCRKWALKDSDFCHRHAQSMLLSPAAVRVIPARGRLQSAEGIHEMLIRVARGLAEGDLSPREANALTYVAQTLLNSLNKVQKEAEEKSTEEFQRQFEALICSQRSARRASDYSTANSPRKKNRSAATNGSA